MGKTTEIKAGIFLSLAIVGAFFLYFPFSVIVEILFGFELPTPNFNVHGGPLLVALFSPLAVIPIISFIFIRYGNGIARTIGIIYAVLISVYIIFLAH